MSKTNNPHDKFVKEIFLQLDLARDFIRNYISEEIIRQFNLSTTKIVQSSFIDEKHKEHLSDCLYSVKTKTGEFVYILMEHKSYVDKKVPFQALKYMTMS